jgi:hypothetical protein
VLSLFNRSHPNNCVFVVKGINPIKQPYDNQVLRAEVEKLKTIATENAARHTIFFILLIVDAPRTSVMTKEQDLRLLGYLRASDDKKAEPAFTVLNTLHISDDNKVELDLHAKSVLTTC